MDEKKTSSKMSENENNTSSSVGKSAGDETVEKAKSEINAQADAMRKEIEERRRRRLARRKEMEQQIQAEEEAKAKRIARLKAQEEAASKKPVPTVTSHDGDIPIKPVSQANSDNDSKPVSERKIKPNRQDKSVKPAENGGENTEKPKKRARRIVSVGETQVMPRITEASIPQRKPAAKKSAPTEAVKSDKPKSGGNTQSKKQDSAPKTRTGTAYAAGAAGAARAKKKTKKNGEVNMLKEIRDWVIAIAAAVIVALLVRNFVFTLVKVQGESMVPTLQENDRLYINRFFYTPEKGDVIVFVPESDPDRPYIKRVIATEGDTLYIDFETGDVYVNDELLDEPYINAKTAREGSYIRELIENGEYGKDNPIVIEEDKIFVMGDNRNNSKDSRDLGQIPIDEVLGGAVFRFWPLSNFGSVSYDASNTAYLIENENMEYTVYTNDNPAA